MKIVSVWFGAVLLLTTPAEADERVLVVPADGHSGASSDRQSGLFWRQSDWYWFELGTDWIFHVGDDARWADPEFDDASWVTLDSAGTVLRAATRAAVRWDGIGWFRLHLRIFPPLRGQSLALVLSQRGAPEICLNGRLIRNMGTVGASSDAEHCVRIDANWPEVIPVHLGDRSNHVIAVRYSNMRNRERPR
jgi:hypothetical protein